MESAGFSMAFIAWHDPASRELKPLARLGDAAHYLDRIKLFTDERPEGQGPAGTQEPPPRHRGLLSRPQGVSPASG